LRAIERTTPKALDLHLIADKYATLQPDDQDVARQASPLSYALHADLGVLAQSGRALLRTVRFGIGMVMLQVVLNVGFEFAELLFLWIKSAASILEKSPAGDKR